MTLPKNVDDIYPLTPMQRLMLLHAVSPAAGGGLVNQVCYHIRGALDAPAFHRAWDAVIARHPALRTAFLYEGLPQPLQAVRSVVTLPFRSVDLSDAPTGERAETLGALRRDDAGAPMPLGRAPLMRCTLVRLGPEQHYFIWTVHHLVVDRWSHTILFAELRALYGAYTRGGDPALGKPPAFRDYVEWTTRQDGAAAERFWREELADVRQPTLLAGAAASARQCRSSTRHVLAIDVTARARERAARFRITPATLLSSVVGLVIANRTGRRDVIYGITVSGRPPELPDADALVGSLVSNLPARLTLHPHCPIAEWVRDVQRAQMRREVHGHVSLTAIHDWSEIPPSRPLFDTLVLLNLTGGPDLVWPGIELVPDTATLDAALPLLLSATMDGGRLAFTLMHDDTFDAPAELLADLDATIVRMTAVDDAAPLAELLQPEHRRSPNVVASVTQPSEPHADSRGQQTVDATTADALLRAWRDVLGIEELGLDDDFFAIGGTSLQ
ncbi:MAG: non-ribosomal peptide synthase/polyketide synthase, partial [Geminicoccaceae bacterium]|nr:non-ribosomal peptide synthase/polyketide synthase [Geminicoccaceae bacterium]